MNERESKIQKENNIRYAQKEPTNEGFVSRMDFINQTGIFVTPGYFDMIYENFKEVGVPADDFIRDYEEKYSTCLQEIELKGMFKYEIADDSLSGLGNYSDDSEPNIWELMNYLALSHDYEWRTKDEIVAKYRDIVKRLQEINKELLQLFTVQTGA